MVASASARAPRAGATEKRNLKIDLTLYGVPTYYHSMRELKQKRIEFRLSEKLLNQIKRVAAERGVRLAEVLRAAVANEAKRSK